MKKNIIQVALWLVAMLALTGCEIEEAETPPNYVEPGLQMLKMAETKLNAYNTCFDIALKLNTYVHTPDSMKLSVEDKYFSLYKIRKGNAGMWYLINNGDTIFKINTRNSNIHDIGSRFTVQYNNYDTLSIVNTEGRKWKLERFEHMGIAPDSCELTLECTSTAAINTFTDGAFKQSGNISFHDEKNIFRFLIQKNYEYEKGNNWYTPDTGACKIYGFNVENNMNGEAIIDFVRINSFERRITVNYKSRTKSFNCDYNLVYSYRISGLKNIYDTSLYIQ